MSCARRHVLITGASSGIGRAAALVLERDGWHVFAGALDAREADSLRAEYDLPGLTPLVLDVTNPEDIAAAAKSVSEHLGDAGLDGLVDNAGIAVAWPLELIPLDLLRRQFEVNVIGQVAVTQAFLPLLRGARGRVVIIGSIGGRISLPFAGPLNSSKSAVGLLADTLRQELAFWGLRVVLIEPASIRTPAVARLQADAARAVSAFPPDGAALYRDVYERMIESAVAREQKGSPPSVVAEAICRALTARRPKARYLVGKDARLLATLSHLPAPVLDAIRRRILGLPREV